MGMRAYFSAFLSHPRESHPRESHLRESHLREQPCKQGAFHLERTLRAKLLTAEAAYAALSVKVRRFMPAG